MPAYANQSVGKDIYEAGTNEAALTRQMKRLNAYGQRGVLYIHVIIFRAMSEVQKPGGLLET